MKETRSIDVQGLWFERHRWSAINPVKSMTIAHRETRRTNAFLKWLTDRNISSLKNVNRGSESLGKKGAWGGNWRMMRGRKKKEEHEQRSSIRWGGNEWEGIWVEKKEERRSSLGMEWMEWRDCSLAYNTNNWANRHENIETLKFRKS